MAVQGIESNFEKLKQAIIEKREKAENTNICKNINVNTNVDNSDDVITGNDVNVITNTNIDVNTNTNNDVNKNVDISTDNKTNGFVNKFVIKVERNEDILVRDTFYLKPETIKEIGYYSELLKIGKSELVRMILEDALNNLEILG